MSDRILIPLDEVACEPVEWIWSGRIPLGGITLVEGDPGDGKSSVMYDLAARVTAGKPMPFEETSVGPAGVVLLQAEDSVATTVRPSIEAAGGDPSKVLVYDRASFANKPLSLPDDKDVITEAIQKVNARLVVIDPLAAFLAGSPNSESTIRKALSELALIAEAEKVAVVIVRHLTKGRSGNTKYRGSGSIGIIGAARSALIVADDPSCNDPHQHILALNKSNLSDASSAIYRTNKIGDTTTVQWLGESPHGVRQLSESGANQFEHSQLEEACYVLYTLLSETDWPVSAKETHQRAKEALVSQRTLMRAKRKLGVTSRRVVGEDNGEPVVRWVWELPKDRSALAVYKQRSTRETVMDCLGVSDLVSCNLQDEAEPETEIIQDNDARNSSWEEQTLPCEEEDDCKTIETLGVRQWDD